MLRRPFHGWRIKQEIQKLTAIRTPSPNLNPVRESPGSSPTRPTPLTSLCPLSPRFFYCQNLPPTSPFRFSRQITKFPLSTSSLATGSAAAYCSRAPEPEPEPSTYLEDPKLNVESLRESSDDRRENGGDGEGFGRRRTPPEERVLLFTCVPEDGECCVDLVRTKPNSQELCREEERTLCITRMEKNVVESHACPLGTLESLKQNPKVVNKLEVYDGDEYGVAKEELKKYGGKVVNKLEVYDRDEYGLAMEELKKYGGKVTPLSEQVSNKLEVYLGRGLRVAYEEAMKYGVEVMMRNFTLQVALCDKMPLSTKIFLVEASLLGYKECDLPWKTRAVPSKCSRLWCLSVLQLLDWIQSGVGRKK